jgi:hypothetical protein
MRCPLQPLVTSSLLVPNILLSTQFSKQHQSTFSLSVRHQTSNAYKRGGKVTDLYSLIPKLLERRGEDKTKYSELNADKRSRNLFSP